MSDIFRDPFFLDKLMARTPCYLYSKSAFLKNYKGLKEKLNTLLFISVKANSDFRLLIGENGNIVDGLEVASLRELIKALNVVENNKIYINNPSMDIDLLTDALNKQVNIIIDNTHQLELLLRHDKSCIKPIVIRLNSSSINKFKLRQTNWKEDHFGVDLDNLPAIIQQSKHNNIKIKGFHIFQGSNTFFNTVSDTLLALKELIEYLHIMLGYPIEIFNLGGGFPLDWDNHKEFDWVSYWQQLRFISPTILWIHESGRGIFSLAGFFITKVLSTKILNNKMIVICDGGIAQNFLLCKTENPLRKYNVPQIIKRNTTPLIKCAYPITFVGTSCSQDDIIAKLPAQTIEPEIGDLIVFSNCGAYNSSYTMPRFLSLGAASRYFID